nr:MAG TPA: hypothetical protein [Caudoviricetes sp.]
MVIFVKLNCPKDWAIQVPVGGCAVWHCAAAPLHNLNLHQRPLFQS